MAIYVSLINSYAINPESAFEAAIDVLNPLAWYRFRETDFATSIEDSSGNNYDLTKQIATAARSAVATRTTHPGGAYFPAVTFDNWATQGTFYKGTTGLLNGVSDYTLLVSMRLIQRASAADIKLFGIGTEDVGDSGTNDLIMMLDKRTEHRVWSKKRHSGGLTALDTNVTEFCEDGVNRLFITRLDATTAYTLSSSKPGHQQLAEDSGGTLTGLDALSRALILNARINTDAGAATTTGFVIDQIALWASDIGATAEANLHALWMDEVAGAGYYPSMMQFDGSTGYYNKTFTSAGHKVTGVTRFNSASYTGGSSQYMLRVDDGTRVRLGLLTNASDHATTTRRNKLIFLVQNSAGTNICRLVSTSEICDSEDHVVFASFDGDTGTAVLRIDGIDEDDTGNAERVAPTTGTLGAGASSRCFVGAGTATPTLLFNGEIGFVGHHEAYLTNYADFMNGNLPKAIDEKNWTEWGAQPLLWSHTGELTNNKGSAGDMTLNGSVVMTTGGSP